MSETQTLKPQKEDPIIGGKVVDYRMDAELLQIWVEKNGILWLIECYADYTIGGTGTQNNVNAFLVCDKGIVKRGSKR